MTPPRRDRRLRVAVKLRAILFAALIASVLLGVASQFALARGVVGHAPMVGTRPVKPAGGPLLIMPLGDSLTAGIPVAGVPNGAYRPELYRLLRKGFYQFRFVGSQVYGPPDFSEKNNEGHGGWRIDQIADNVDSWMNSYVPDIVLLGAGGNDEKQDYSVEAAPDRLLKLARRISELRPNCIVLVQTRPVRSDGLQAINKKFDDRVRALFNEETKKNQLIRLVDNADVLEKSDLSPDGVHPSIAGNKKLAAAWYAAIEAALRETANRPLAPEKNPPTS